MEREEGQICAAPWCQLGTRPNAMRAQTMGGRGGRAGRATHSGIGDADREPFTHDGRFFKAVPRKRASLGGSPA